ncbi:hypothetical protein E6P09_16380 (plasmid) [Haloferax mediterranei ATCC 33500]|uniref:Uncharacterized protein n=1 Tax=Haloferax mediterranei (strain ATCC 33500 / DSM 1411 / JCM 8866 / NBRC 14739 / NCIMB 2177 / R-4) TaxID=523841 RepID=I3RB19_HALMT|nr:hypothetical protein [Haloferax mediterranei]AFK21429.1 hypothetical protein HFX_6307 [Haloferax mediterranei ATCC 33500]AHZ24501.1 hypothetical protein BM92_16460 [Haloferax mediterranei ATCC 33500]ELZ97253.1 hypothetical protein C439_18063 [Haloferax mediterranei ATCC 33500]MDX5990011.1 hypothetical protein [Haloferax mediterranei ATCC 33500]QCQ76899.1 hypothetical protein E6P09_16380 [Haloferax mediterranei ATCC 33500]
MISDYDRLRQYTERVGEGVSDEGVNDEGVSDGRVNAKGVDTEISDEKIHIERVGEKISDGGVNTKRVDESVRDREANTDEVDESVNDEGVDTWFAREVPSIVAGLEASQFIDPVTAETAWDLIASGCAEEALSLVLGEVDESWRE